LLLHASLSHSALPWRSDLLPGAHAGRQLIVRQQFSAYISGGRSAAVVIAIMTRIATSISLLFDTSASNLYTPTEDLHCWLARCIVSVIAASLQCLQSMPLLKTCTATTRHTGRQLSVTYKLSVSIPAGRSAAVVIAVVTCIATSYSTAPRCQHLAAAVPQLKTCTAA